MKKREANFSLLLRHWIRANPQYTCSIETKQTIMDSIGFSEIKKAQIDYALAIESDEGVLIRTQAIVEGMPDYIYLRNEPAFIAIKFKDFFVLIRIGLFLKEKKQSKRKSLTGNRAIEIASITVYL